MQRQVKLPIHYDGICLDDGLRIDLIVGDALIVELKAIERIAPVHIAQVISYLKMTGYRLALLINFNVATIREGIERIAL